MNDKSCISLFWIRAEREMSKDHKGISSKLTKEEAGISINPLVETMLAAQFCKLKKFR